MSPDDMKTIWPLELLRNLCDVITDGSHFSPTPQSTGKLIANVKDMRDGYIDVDTCTGRLASGFQ